MIASDVAMPATDGPTMIREVRKLRPAMPVPFMSGYAEEQLRDQIGITDVHFLPKPFSGTADFGQGGGSAGWVS